MKTINHLFDLLTRKERRNLYILFAAVLIMAALEVVSVASIMPFLSVASDPSSIQESVYLSWAYEAFNFPSRRSFLVALGIGALLALVISNVYIVCVTWLQSRYVWGRNHSISRRLLRNYINRPYKYFLSRNSSDLSKNILQESEQVSVRLMYPALQGITKGIVAIAIILFLVYVDPAIALIVSLVLGGSYGLIWFFVQGKLGEVGNMRVNANERRYQSVSEAFGGIKEVKLKGKEPFFVRQYSNPSSQYSYYQALNDVISKVPRYALEAVAFGGIILIAIYLIVARDDIGQVVPVLGLYAFAGYRLMPALQSTFRGLSRARFNSAALETLHRDMYEQKGERHLKVREPVQSETSLNERENGTKAMDADGKLEVEEKIVVDDITFTYPNSNKPAIKGVSMKVPAQSVVGIAGKTGSGKTTVVDVMLGLLKPEKGAILIDGLPLQEKNIDAWQGSVGYVPQEIYLADVTIAENVAFGLPKAEIDYDRVEKVLREAHIWDFVINELSDGLQTDVGERGVKLSGGQRQRIGIARALYDQPSVIFFDEATSALDQKTEEGVMEAIYKLGETRTVVLISHRPSTMRRAGRIFILEKGRLRKTGSYEELAPEGEGIQELFDNP